MLSAASLSVVTVTLGFATSPRRRARTSTRWVPGSRVRSPSLSAPSTKSLLLFRPATVSLALVYIVASMSKESDAKARALSDRNFCPETSVSAPDSRNGRLR